MGRNSKIRQQRKHSALTEISSGTQMPSQLSAKASSLSQKPLPKQPSENTSFWGKIAASLKPFPKVGKYQPGMDAHAFSEENQVLVGASAWEGYQQQGKGLVLVQNSDSSPPQIEYIPRQLLKKTMRQYGLATEDIRAMDNMIEVYEPTNSVVMVYVNNDGEISASMSPQTEPTLKSVPACYRRQRNPQLTTPSYHKPHWYKSAQLTSSGIRVRNKASSIQSK